MTKTARWALLGLILSTLPGRAEVLCPERPGLVQERLASGELRLSLADDAPVRDTWVLLLDHAQEELGFRTLSGQPLELSGREMERENGRLRTGLRVPSSLLSAGLVVREAGSPVERPRLLSTGSAPDWRPDAFMRIQVKNTGMVRITGEWLEEELDGAFLPDPRRWSLYHNGQLEPLYVFGDEDGIFDPADYIEFYSEPTLVERDVFGPDMRLDPWSSREIFFLCDTGSPGFRFAQESGEITETDPGAYVQPLTFREKLHLEQDNSFSRLGYVLDEAHPDHSMWTPGVYGGELLGVPFELPGLQTSSSQPVYMTFCFRGLSGPTTEGAPDIYQRLRLYVNETGGASLELGGDNTWMNQGLRIVEFGPEVFPDHQGFINGNNELFIAGVDEAPAGPYSAAMLNWMDVSYQRLYEADDGALVFSAESSLDGQLVDITVKGFQTSSIDLYKVGRSRFRSTIVREVSGEYRMRFQDVYHQGDRYLAIEPDARILPESLQLLAPVDVSQEPASRIATIVVVPDSLFAHGAAEILEGLLVDHGDGLVFSDRAVYDRFTHGRTDPHAFRDFLQWTWSHWTNPPEHMLLIGDGFPIQRVITPGREPILPLFYEQVRGWGAASSDDWFATTVTGERLPVNVTRWPAASPEELQLIFNKATRYGASDGASWTNSLLFTAGAKTRDEGAFQALTEEMIAYSIPGSFHLSRIEAGELATRYLGGRDELVTLINRGQLVSNYSGHGGGAVWEDNGLFSTADIPLLDNADRLSFFTNATCFIGSLDYNGGLGRALLSGSENGAIAVLGSTGLGYRNTSMELLGIFFEYLLPNPDMQLAEALRFAKQDLWLRYENQSEEWRQLARAVNTMMVLLGLPWQEIHTPVQAEAPQVAPAVLRVGESAQITGAGDSGVDGLVELYGPSGHPVLSSSDYINDVIQYEFTTAEDGAWSISIPAPEGLWEGGSRFTTRVWIGGERPANSHAWVYYADSLESDFAWQAQLLPDPPRPDSMLAVELLFASATPVDSLVSRLRAWAPGGDSSEQRLRMTFLEEDPQRWRTAAELGPFTEGTTLALSFLVYRGGASSETPPGWYDVRAPGPELVLALDDAGTLNPGHGLFRLQNNGDAYSGDLRARILDADGVERVYQELGGIAPGEETRLDLPLNGLSLDTLSTLSLACDTDSTALSLSPASTRITTSEETRLAAGLACSLAMDDSPVLLLWKEELAGASEKQPGLAPTSVLYHMEPEDAGTEGAFHGWAVGHVADSLFVLDRESGLALRPLAGDQVSLSGDTLDFVLRGAGGFCFGQLTDTAAPGILLEAEGQVFSSGGFVPREAVFTLLLEDENGIDPRPERLQIHVDDQLVSRENLAGASFPGGMSLTLPVADMIDPLRDEHSLSVLCHDAAGNQATETVLFRSGDHLGLEYIGNYPNPFQRDTRFIFSLTGVADKVSVEIYTVSGRKIRTLNLDGPIINYVELPWDGRDRVGDVVANGVYFYLFKAWSADESIEHQGKVARLK